jgi:CheY-like chemotaxis protein/signal transduction histidine kinase
LRLSFRAKLIAIVGTAASALLVLIAASTAISARAEQELATIQERHLPRLQLGPRLDASFEQLKRALQDAVAARDPEAVLATHAIEAKFLEQIDGAGAAVTPGQAAVLRSAMDDYYGAAVDVSRRLIAGETGERLVDAMSAMQAKQARAADLLQTVTAFNPAELATAFAAARRAEITGGRIRLLVSLICLLGVVLLSWWIGRGVLRSLANVAVGLRRFGDGDFSRPIPVTSRDEMADLARQANQMAESLQRLGRERDRNDWVREALAGLGQELRGELDPGDLATRAISFLSRYLEAAAGAFYYLDADQTLALYGQYGGAAVPATDAGAAPRFRIGEGLVGQAALVEELTVINDPPADYLRIRSGLGEGAPRVIVLLPLRHLGRVRGVLELALFARWTERSAEALLVVRESLVIAMEVARARIATRDLLTETQRQAERLVQQEEELRSTNEELQTQQEELRQTNQELTDQAEELEAQRRALEQNNAELEEARQGLEQKATELTTVSSYKSQFLANMSHELRTPLNSMLLLSNLLAENDSRNLTPKQVEFASTIHKAGKDLLVLINQVLDLSKIEAGKHELQVARVPVAEIADHARRIFGPLAADKGLRFAVEIAPGLPDTLTTDRRRVEQILNNLLGNAIKFTGAGEVALRIGPALLRNERAVAFAVSDTGVGVAPEHQERIFSPFEQVDGAIDRRYGGTGLGLSISRELASLLGGELQLRSTLGEGSTFVCLLPFEGPQMSSPGSTSSSASDAARRKIGASPERSSDVASDASSDAASDASPAVSSTAPFVVASSNPRSDRSSEVPSRGARGAALPAGPRARAPRTNESLLLVIEDDPVVAEALGEIIRGQGLECLIAPDGTSGLRLASQRRPVGIILDVKLPDVDGWAVMAALRAHPVTARIPIHVVSAANAAERALALGAVGYLTKPASPGDLLRVVESLTARLIADGHCRVLVVEDDPLTADNLEKALANEQISLRRVPNGTEALAALSAERFSCLILDLSLPDMDGLDLLQRLRERYGAGMPAVLIYTARALSPQETKRLEADTEAVVLKEGSSTERLMDEVRLFARRLKEGLGPRRPALARLHPADLNLAGKEILIADNDMRTAYALSATLRAKGVEVLVAGSGPEAIDILNKQPGVDALLIDVATPAVDGLETTRRLRRDPRFRTLRIVALTGKAAPVETARCLEAGANHHLGKPVDAEKLLALLHLFFSEEPQKEPKNDPKKEPKHEG